MTNLECAIAVLATHREARRWTDEAVAADLMVQLKLDPQAVVGPAQMPDMSSAQQNAAHDAAAGQPFSAAPNAAAAAQV